jgi:NAD(P)-dependent dehydrogenase (short-subunit alcohol dehydrogenase family)
MKFGMVGYVRSLAKRLAPEIRANVICPGGVDTPMLRQFIQRPDMDEVRGKNVEELLVASRKNYPFGRAARPEEIANAALFLLSSEASYVSGATLAVDGCVTA